MNHTDTRLYDPVGSITFLEFADIIDDLRKAVEKSSQSADVKSAKLEMLAAVRSHVSSTVEEGSED